MSNSIISHVPLLDKLLFVKNLALMIKAGLPLQESITSIQEQSKNKFFKKVLENVIKNIDNGQSLAVSLSRYPRIFDLLYINMIKIGEEAGTLEENLGYLASQLEKSNSLKRKALTSMIYPAIVLTSTFILGGVLSVFILPKLTPLFKSLNVALPLSTKILLCIAELIHNYGLYIFLSFPFLILFIIIIYRLKPVKLASHRILLALPVAGRISQNINLSLFSKTLAILIKSGVPIVEALDITIGVLSNLIYRNSLKEISLRIQKGEQMGVCLRARPKLFPATFSRLIEVGEKTGNLENSSFYLSDFYEAELDDIMERLSTILEPILLIVVGFVVAFVAISIITPIYQLTRGLPH